MQEVYPEQRGNGTAKAVEVERVCRVIRLAMQIIERLTAAKKAAQ